MNRVPTPQMQAILERLAREDAGLPDPTTLPPAAGRRQAAETSRRWNRDLPEMEVRALTLAGGDGQPMACRIYRPEGAGPQGAVLHLHGGGWAFGNLDTHERAARKLALACRLPVLSCDYRLAPEHPFPAGLEDCRAAWRALRGGAAGLAGPFAVAGDSAGANLALALMLAETAPQGGGAPDAGLLFYGAFAADFDTESFRAFADGPGLTRDRMRRFWDWYASGDQRSDPLAAPPPCERLRPPRPAAALAERRRTRSPALRVRGPRRAARGPGPSRDAAPSRRRGAWLHADDRSARRGRQRLHRSGKSLPPPAGTGRLSGGNPATRRENARALQRVWRRVPLPHTIEK